MPRQNVAAELIPGKIRKRGCSSSASSSSSILQNYRFKRAILVGKRTGSRSPASAFPSTESPTHELHQCGSARSKQAPVSARKLAATLWEMNELPLTTVKEGHERKSRKEMKAIEKTTRSIHSGSLPPHLSDPSHSPVSERGDRLGTGSRRTTPSMSQRLKLADHGVGVLDSVRTASFMEIETRSRVQTPSISNVGVRSGLKDINNTLTTSKELLKIITRVWGQEDRPSTSMSLISALHAELERARLQINQLIQEQRYEQNEISCLMRWFAEEKEAWKSKEQEVVEAAIESVAGELEVERKLRRRLESLNKKLGRELGETKSSLVKVVKEFESERRGRGRESAKLSAVLREEQTHVAKNGGVDALRDEVEAFLGIKRAKEEVGEVVDLSESDVHSIELNMENYKSYDWIHCCRRPSIDDELKATTKSNSKKGSRKSMSDGLEWGRSSVMEKVGCSKNLRDQILYGSRLGSLKVTASPTRAWEQARPSRDLADTLAERASLVQGNGLKCRGNGVSSRKYK
ncbi:uncharacterized protein At5g41620-like [Cucurbita maxima]|uniref:Uncharacterized protein At5g41620-like n=1 Tax=Cucurbita maxima TaxID=3661 RepID=A0A6J1J5U0_CUCMA|nr:uncharacterized protein At5g41620-like [Cucurbita maxima]XP_022982909.1 uncharacterized protein At5g41620-like [Cucurbita maxima]